MCAGSDRSKRNDHKTACIPTTHHSAAWSGAGTHKSKTLQMTTKSMYTGCFSLHDWQNFRIWGYYLNHIGKFTWTLAYFLQLVLLPCGNIWYLLGLVVKTRADKHCWGNLYTMQHCQVHIYFYKLAIYAYWCKQFIITQSRFVWLIQNPVAVWMSLHFREALHETATVPCRTRAAHDKKRRCTGDCLACSPIAILLNSKWRQRRCERAERDNKCYNRVRNDETNHALF